jgi:RNA-binding protein
MQLSYAQRKKLKAIAHGMKPVVQIGKKGLTDDVVKAIDAALSDHELIKVQFVDFKEEKKELVGDITERTSATLVAIIGHRAILYRENPEKEIHVL